MGNGHLGRTDRIHTKAAQGAFDGGIRMSVTEEARAFFASNKIPIDKMAAVGTYRLQLSAEAVEEAAQRVFEDVQEGREIPQIRLAWQVYSLAKRLKATTDARERREMEAMRRRLAWLEQPWYRRIFRRMT